VSGFLLDTNVISELRKPRPNDGVVRWIENVDEHLLFLSVVTIGELRTGIDMVAQPKKRGDLEAWLVSAVTRRFAGRILPFDLEVAEQWGVIEARARLGAGKLPVVDALIAATAIRHGLTIVSHNVRDFSRTGGAVLSPWN
jgi:toxin FitB